MYRNVKADGLCFSSKQSMLILIKKGLANKNRKKAVKSYYCLIPS